MDYEKITPVVWARYLGNNSPDEEARKVERWITGSKKHRQKFVQIKTIWKQSANRPEFEKKLFDLESDWQELKKRITESDDFSPDAESVHPSLDYNVTRNRFWPALSRAAAVFLIMGLLGFFAYRSLMPFNTPPSKPVLREISTALAQRVNLTLSDGTSVLLNAGSTLRLPQTFEPEKREVFLEGQAFFKVAENPDRPFVIHTGSTQTRVLGTAFSVRAYPGENNISVAVRQGRVAFSSKVQQVILTHHELGKFNISEKNIESGVINDMGLYFGWVDGYLKFKDAPLSQVAMDLERRYGVDVRFKSTNLEMLSLTALLKSRSIRNVLDVISTSLDIRYKLSENEVIFYQ